MKLDVEGAGVVRFWNADGEEISACGNGTRCVGWLLMQSSGKDRVELETKAGRLIATRAGERLVSVDMGPAVVGEPVDVDGASATCVDMGNPHAVVQVPSVAGLGELKTSRLDLNVEYVEDLSPTALAMRVHERGVGETRSCGTGACALVVAQVLRSGEGRGEPYDVDVPGGRLVVTWREDGHVLLSGPAVLVAEGDVRDDWLEGRG